MTCYGWYLLQRSLKSLQRPLYGLLQQTYLKLHIAVGFHRFLRLSGRDRAAPSWIFSRGYFMNKFLKSLLKTGLYWVEQFDRGTADIRDRVTDRVERLSDRMRRASRAKEDHTVRNAISFAAGVGFGVGLGILFAPASGDETRSSVAEHLRDVGGRIQKQVAPELKQEHAATSTERK